MKTVLVVDDNKIIRDVLALILETLPACAVRTAQNGKEAVEILRAQPVDAVITDLAMPVMDGYELIRHIRTRSVDLPVLAMSADPRSFVQASLDVSMIGRFFEKPFDIEEVAREISSVLGLIRNTPPPAPSVRAALYESAERAVSL